MLAPVIFISLRCTAIETANALGAIRLKRSEAPINIYSIVILYGIYIPDIQRILLVPTHPVCQGRRDAKVFFYAYPVDLRHPSAHQNK
ncbi:hypothetical protein NLO95_20045 [Pseudomonas syringae]|nr:hypothetical protein [Pseudomonas syringae]